MNDFLSIVSMIIIATPIVIGVLAFAGHWLADHFYTEPFYDDYEH